MKLYGLRVKLFAATALILLATIGITLWLLAVAESRLRDRAFDQLRAVRETKALQIETEIAQFVANLDVLANSQAASGSLAPLTAAFAELDDADDDALADYYAGPFASRSAAYQPDGAVAMIPEAVPGRAVQSLYMATNPWPVGEKDSLFNAFDGSEYSELHASVHGFFRTALERFGAYDIFLIDPAGNIVYSVFKEIDVGTNLADGPHSASGLARAWQRSVDTGGLALVDFAPYTPSYGAPAAFAARPVFDDGGPVGTVAMQAPIDRINDVMTSNGRWSDIGLGESGETYIVAADNTMRNDSRFLIEDPDGFYAALDEAGIPTAAIEQFDTTIGLLLVDTEGTRDATAGNEGRAIFPDYREVDVLSDYGPLDLPAGLDWMIMSEIDAAEAFGPADDTRRLSLVVLGITAVVMFGGMWIVATRLTRPLRTLEAETVALREVSFAAGDDYDRTTLDEVARRRDEIGDLAGSFSRLVASLQENVSQRVAIEGELNVAADIQQSLLPLTFPQQPEYTEFDLHAALVPAKEVGGDFYDFGEVGVDHYYFLVGDVSGKGVPAALFMAATKTLIRSGALSGEPVEEMLTRVNAEIAESNPEFMFATVWMGVLDLRTGEVEFTNAGHNPPLLDGEYVTESHGPFVGPIPGVTYTSGRITMQPGSRLIVYSDGVTEAMNPDGDLFGEDRLAAMDLPSTAEGATSSIVNSALAWEHGTRSDDLTVLALDLHRLRESVELSVTFTDEEALAAVSELNAAVDEFGRRHEIPAEAAAKTMMALDEIVTNVLTHGSASRVTVTVNWRDGWLVTTVADDGAPFDPLGAPEPDTTKSLHERELGGLGIHLVRGVMTDMEYTYTDGRNVLTMKLHTT